MIKAGTVPATCNHCSNDVNIPVEDVNLLVNPNTKFGSYAFTCKCGGAVVKLASPTIVELLEGRGVEPHEASEVLVDTFPGVPEADEFLDTASRIRKADSENIWSAILNKD